MTTRLADASNREVWIDCLRGLAATAVALFHLNEVRPKIDFYGAATHYGFIGVPVFFAISGYCIALVVQRSPDWRSFVVARFARIYIPFWFNLLLIGAIIAGRIVSFGTNDIVKLPKEFFGLFAHVVLLISPVTTIDGVNWVYWSLTFELVFYLVVSASLALGRYCGLLLFAVTVASLVPQLTLIKPLFFLQHWGLFALGFAMAFRQLRKDLQSWLLLIAAIASVAINESLPYILGASIFAVAAYAQRLMAPMGAWFPVRALQKLGDISYSIYLLHVPLGVFVLGRVVELSSPRNAPVAMAIDLVLLLGVFFASLATYKYIEVPSISFGKRIARRWTQHSPARQQAATLTATQK